jgi:hypothetical protein
MGTSVHFSNVQFALLTRYSAITIGCSPAFAVFIRKRINSSKRSGSHAHAYLKQPTHEDIKLKSIISPKPRPKRDNMEAYWDETHSSQEELAKNSGHTIIRN